MWRQASVVPMVALGTQRVVGAIVCVCPSPRTIGVVSLTITLWPLPGAQARRRADYLHHCTGRHLRSESAEELALRLGGGPRSHFVVQAFAPFR